MLSKFCGYPLKTGVGFISITNLVLSVIFILYYLWERSVDYGYSHINNNWRKPLDDVFMDNITIIFMNVGSVSAFANFGLKQATLKNETHKIYLWLLFGYVQIVTMVLFEADVLCRNTMTDKNLIRVVLGFLIVDAILVYQLLVVQSFYKEEKLVEETSYARLRSEMITQQVDREDRQWENESHTIDS
ncbi:uncharacterized protein LOC126840507 [Adelges cooleyi]|uniref:uncharacterized protein LOC126840507 n=1 Tax=Adelges cooleyi TaxID=133065 RepID=UPI00217F6678|nr:uncharacterized protein LOC126840507 [Adelges cooleyi]